MLLFCSIVLSPSQLANRPATMYHPALVSFLCSDTLFKREGRPMSFWLPSTRPQKRDFVCALPLPYLHAGLAYLGLPTTVTSRFECAELILAHLEGMRRPVQGHLFSSLTLTSVPVHVLFAMPPPAVHLCSTISYPVVEGWLMLVLIGSHCLMLTWCRPPCGAWQRGGG